MIQVTGLQNRLFHSVYLMVNMHMHAPLYKHSDYPSVIVHVDILVAHHVHVSARICENSLAIYNETIIIHQGLHSIMLV